MVDQGMSTISSKISKKEHDVIIQYANACGETISNLARKVLLTDATFMNFYHDSHGYNYSISIPENSSGEEESHLVLGVHNKIRRILGLQEQEEL